MSRQYVQSTYKTRSSVVSHGCLYFDSSLGHHVNHGYFWNRSAAQGQFFWEAWVNADIGAEYIISDGYGGAHNLLFGLNGANPCSPGGNIYSSGTVSFGSNDTFLPGEWHHVAVGWDGTNIRTYIDGVPSAATAFSGTRQTTNDASEGTLFIGGSTHSNYKGFIKCVRGFEGVSPLASPANAFHPDQDFVAAFSKTDNTTLAASFVADYTMPAAIVPDLSGGFGGSVHPGRLREGNDTDAGTFGGGYYAAVGSLPPWRSVLFAAPAYTGSVTSTPGGAVVFDAFERDNVTYAWANSLGLGTAPTGQTWTATAWGILGTYAFQSINSSNQFAVIETGKSDYDARMTRKAGTSNTPSLVVRYTDSSNYVEIQMDASGQCAVVEYISGVGNTLASGGAFGTSWLTLRGVTSGTNLTVYLDGSGTPIRDVTMNVALTGSKAGMVSQVPLHRVKSFTVY